MRWGLGLVVSAAIIAGCSSGSGSPSSGGGGNPPALATLEARGNLQNCFDTQKLYAVSAAQCDFRASGDVELAAFGDNGTRDTYVRVGKASGGFWVVGDRWAVDVRSGHDAAQQLADVLGGKVQ